MAESSVMANVKVMVEIPSGSVWSHDTTVDQVKRQALEGFEWAIRDINNKCGPKAIKIVGTPEVQMVIMNPEIEKK